ncbi:MAG: efflux RND transporter periplasmic adaptor subunit [Bacteroidia bacterium]
MKTNHIIIAGFTLALFFQSCSSGHDKSEAPPAVVQPIETFLLKKDKFSTSFQLPGELIAFQQVDLYAKVTGFVKELKVDIGSEVTEGELLMTLEAPELSSQLVAAESKLQSLEAIAAASQANYDRIIETSKTPGTISQNDIDQAAARKKSDFANLDAAKASYKEVAAIRNYLEIRAPFAGIITARNVNLGAYVGPAGKGSEFPLLTLQEQKHLRLAISVPEAFTGYLKSGDTVSFKVKAFPNENFKTTVKRMAGALDLKLRSEKIEMDVINDAKKLLPGMVAEVSLKLIATDSSFVVPKSALVSSGEGTYVIKSVGNKALKTDVKKGREINSQVEIFGKLMINDTLVKNANEELKDGAVLKK